MTDLSTRLYLVTPPIADLAAFAPKLDEALGAGEIGCVLLRLAPGEAAATVESLRSLVAAVQIHGVAALVEDGTRHLVGVEADGVHVAGQGDALFLALRDLKPSRIVGAGQLQLRDDAMLAGEQDIDYVMFGEAWENDPVQDFDERLERVAWWAEIFQVPCVAFAHAAEEVEVFAAHGAEFVALGDVIWADPRGPGAAIRDAEAAVRAGSAAFAARQLA